MVHAGCWAHARRYFFQAVQLNGKDLVPLGIVVEIDKLFEIEADAKSAGLGAGERLELRREKAEPILKGLKTRPHREGWPGGVRKPPSGMNVCQGVSIQSPRSRSKSLTRFTGQLSLVLLAPHAYPPVYE
jgi:Transposase IS66 family